MNSISLRDFFFLASEKMGLVFLELEHFEFL